MVINIFFSKLENECLLLTEDLKYIEECKKRRLINPHLEITNVLVYYCFCEYMYI